MSQNKINKSQKGSLQKRMILIFSVFSLISLGTIATIILSSFQVSQNSTQQQSENALISQIQTNMLKSADENSLVTSQKVKTAIDNVVGAAEYAEHLFQFSQEFGSRVSYNDTDMVAPGLNAQYDSNYLRVVSLNYSCYHLAPTSYDSTYVSNNYVGSYDTANATVKDLVNRSAILDYIFKSMKESNPDLAWVYMGFQAGIHRCYPWHTYNSTYDPRSRSWFKLATAAPGSVQITSPYIDASGLGLMITIARTVHWPNGSIIGVIGADLTIDTIVENILNIKLLKEGYAFLIDSNGLTIAHPQMSQILFESKNGVVNITDFEPIAPNLLSIKQNTHGILSIQKNGNNSYLAYSKVNNTAFFVLNIVSEKEALESAIELDGEISTISGRISGFTITIVLVSIGAAIFLGILIASKIISPVKHLTEAVNRLTRHDLAKSLLQSTTEIHIDPALEEQNDEFGDLTRAFRGMLETMKNEKNQSK